LRPYIEVEEMNVDEHGYSKISKTKAAALPFQVVQKKPRFQGEDVSAFARWITGNLVYPKLARENGIQGKVMVEVIIDAQGYVVEAIVLNEVDHLLDTEALRVIYNSPRWKPAKHEGRSVPVSCVFPVLFKLR